MKPFPFSRVAVHVAVHVASLALAALPALVSMLLPVPANAQAPAPGAAPMPPRSATPARPPGDTMAERVAACVACHGAEGRATTDGFYPRIAGKPEGYLFNQLVNFREGRRDNATMRYLVSNMPDAYLLSLIHI